MKRTDQLWLKFPPDLGQEVRARADRNIRKISQQIEWMLRFQLLAERLFFSKPRFAKFRLEILAQLEGMTA